MAQQLEQCVIRILNAKGRVVGAGFVVAHRLAVTCAHVVQAAESGQGKSISFQFYADTTVHTAQVMVEGWSPSDTGEDANDVAFLLLQSLPEDVIPAILGAAGGRNRHKFTALGFAHLAVYEDRWADGYLSGVVPVLGKRPTLQFEGRKIKEGMSGAPVLDLDTNRVVGMVCEYKDDAGERFAWATTTDTLQVLNPTLKLWPDEYGPDDLHAYLTYLIDTNRSLKMLDGREVELERVYISLRADEMNEEERQAEYDFLHDEVAELKKSAERSMIDRYALYAAMRKAITRHPLMLKLKACQWVHLFADRQQGTFSLAEVVRRDQYVVLLGDPGSGKTTLGKWLVLQYARALLQGKTYTEVREDSVRPSSETNRRISLGPSRLPVFIHIADYAHLRWDKEKGNTEIPLEWFIYHPHKLSLALKSTAMEALIKDYLLQGRVLLILDGLDEVSDPAQRREVMSEVNKLIHSQLSRPSPSRARTQVLLTSRIVGYQFQPLTYLPHYTVEDMDETAIGAFCEAWMTHAAESSDALEEAQKLKDAIFDHAHPGVKALAGNPLLLTILAQVYHMKRTLPTRRVALFEAATQALYDQRKDFWGRVGITPRSLTRALGAVAAYIHTYEVTGFAEEGTVIARLEEIFINEPEQVEAVLSVARDISGCLVARGEGVYGFLHRALQEYFAAKHLIDQPGKIIENLGNKLLDPTWREPIVLAVGMVSQQNYSDSKNRLPKLFDLLLNFHDPVGEFIPRRELLAVATFAECVRVPEEVYQSVADRLLTFYAQKKRFGTALRVQIQRAFASLMNNQDSRVQADLVLGNALQADDFERRYAAIDIIIESKWGSPSVAQAVLATWRTYSGPAASSLMAIDEMSQRNPGFSELESLPLRQAVIDEPALWRKAKTDSQWRLIVSVLYLPPTSDFKPELVNRDSPLTPWLVDALTQLLKLEALRSLKKRVSDFLKLKESKSVKLTASNFPGLETLNHLKLEALDSRELEALESLEFKALNSLKVETLNFQELKAARDLKVEDLNSLESKALNRLSQNLFSTLIDFDTAEARDASVILGIRDEESWIDALEHAENKLHVINSLIVIFARAVSCALNAACASARSTSRFPYYVKEAQTLTGALETLAADIQTIASAGARSFDRTEIAIHAFADAQAHSASLIDGLNRAEMLIGRIRSIVGEETVSYKRVIGEKERVSYKATVSPKALLKQKQALAAVEIVRRNILISMRLTKVFDTLLTIGHRWYRVEATPSTRTSTSDYRSIDDMVADLSSLDDRRRENARRVCMSERLSSELGKTTIERIAKLAHLHTDNPQVGPELVKALSRVIYDTPSWLQAWIAQGGMKNETAIRVILSEIHFVTPETFEVILDAIPSAATHINIALLQSFKRLVRMRQIPEWSSAREKLLSWLNSETDAQIRHKIIEILGYWLEAPDEVRAALLDRLHSSFPQSDLPALYMALAYHVAAHQLDTNSSVQTALRSACPHPAAAAALIRLSLLKTRGESRVKRHPFSETKYSKQGEMKGGEQQENSSEKLLQMLNSILTSTSQILAALLDAGRDEDDWLDQYHDILIHAASIHLDRHPDLLQSLLVRLHHSINEQDWPHRRIVLAAVAACIEVMPMAVQKVWQQTYPNSLEDVLVKATTDATSFTVRRFAISALGYLRTITPAVVPALLTVCRDIEAVQRDAVETVKHFQSIKGDLLPTLAAALTGPSVITAYTVAQLLGALGASAAGEAAHLRGQVIDALVGALKDAESKREVLISGESKGTLEDTFYVALLQAAGWLG